VVKVAKVLATSAIFKILAQSKQSSIVQKFAVLSPWPGPKFRPKFVFYNFLAHDPHDSRDASEVHGFAKEFASER
jgi:hypothetical protein